MSISWVVKEVVHEISEGAFYTDICICENGLPVIVYMDHSIDPADPPNHLNWLRHAIKKEGTWYIGLQSPHVNWGWYATCACDQTTQLIKTATYLSAAMVLDPGVERQISASYPTDENDFAHSRPESVGNLGKHISLALDSNNNEHLAYLNEISNYKLRYAHYDGANWNFEAPDSPDYSGFENAIACDGLIPHILHYISYPTTKVRHIWKSGGSWTKESIEEGTANCGRYGAITIDSIHQPHVAYYCNGDLKYSCKDGGGWNTEIVEAIGSTPLRLSIATDSNNKPYILYYESNNSILKIAYKINGSFTIETVDDDGTAVGKYPSITIDSNDFIHVSYAKEWAGTAGLWYATDKSPVILGSPSALPLFAKILNI